MGEKFLKEDEAPFRPPPWLRACERAMRYVHKRSVSAQKCVNYFFTFKFGMLQVSENEISLRKWSGGAAHLTGYIVCMICCMRSVQTTFLNLVLLSDNFAHAITPVLKHLSTLGNTTVYQWRNGVAPDKIVKDDCFAEVEETPAADDGEVRFSNVTV